MCILYMYTYWEKLIVFISFFFFLIMNKSLKIMLIFAIITPKYYLCLDRSPQL